VETTEWRFEGRSETRLVWDCDPSRDGALDLYDKGKQAQWDAASRLAWEQDLDPENPTLLDDGATTLFGSAVWRRMTARERTRLRHHQQAYMLSQFMHGEQGALIASARIVQAAPDLNAKFFAATQAMDEARHVEIYRRMLHEKLELWYPITPGLRSLIEGGLADARWDMTYLATQVLIEGLALAALQRLRETMRHPLAASVNALIMQDESRHVAFGRVALRSYYRELSDAERRERSAFVAEALHVMRTRLDQREMFERLGLPVAECVRIVQASRAMRTFRSRLAAWVQTAAADIGLAVAPRYLSGV
jgi:hypothetical protein